MSVQREREFGPQTDMPRPGEPVLAASGEYLGSVIEVSGSYFKVDAPMKRDYWLSCEYVAEHGTDGVRLSFSKGGVEEHKLSEPGLEPQEDPMREITRDTVILSDDEMLEQRARMERELAEQRKELPIHERGTTGGTIGEPVESELERLQEELGQVDTGSSPYSSSTGAMITKNRSDEDWDVDQDEVTARAPYVALAVAVFAVAAFLLIRYVRSR